MKTWAFCGAALLSLAMAACSSSGNGGSGSGSGGAGGSGGGATTGTSSPTSTGSVMTVASSSGSGSSGTVSPTSTSSTGGGDPCDDGTDCSQCADQKTCFTCEQGQHSAAAAQLYNTLVECVVCTACYTVCQGAAQGCTSAPPAADACDTGTCAACQMCAQGATCKPELGACTGDPECLDLAQKLNACPQ